MRLEFDTGMVVGEEFEEDVNDGELHRNDNEVAKQGKGKMRKRIGEEQQASWANVIARVQKHAEVIHQQKKRAVRACKGSD
jgi:hypothetical protein